MKANAPIRRWTPEDLAILRKYIKTNSTALHSHFLVNVVAGYMRFRKPKQFFKRLGKLLCRPSKLCKSKFQKAEKIIYTDYLRFPQTHYDLLRHLRTRSAGEVDYSFIVAQPRAQTLEGTPELSENNPFCGTEGFLSSQLGENSSSDCHQKAMERLRRRLVLQIQGGQLFLPNEQRGGAWPFSCVTPRKT